MASAAGAHGADVQGHWAVSHQEACSQEARLPHGTQLGCFQHSGSVNEPASNGWPADCGFWRFAADGESDRKTRPNWLGKLGVGGATVREEGQNEREGPERTAGPALGPRWTAGPCGGAAAGGEGSWPAAGLGVLKVQVARSGSKILTRVSFTSRVPLALQRGGGVLPQSHLLSHTQRPPVQACHLPGPGQLADAATCGLVSVSGRASVTPLALDTLTNRDSHYLPQRGQQTLSGRVPVDTAGGQGGASAPAGHAAQPWCPWSLLT